MVGVTFGPGGRHVAVARGAHGVDLTRDGASVAREIFPADDFVRQGAELVKEAANKVSDRWGDGSTTATVLAAALLRRSIRLVEAGHEPGVLARQLHEAAQDVLAHLEKTARAATPADVRSVTLGAAGHEDIATLVADAFISAGPETSVLVRRSRRFGVEMEPHHGFRFDRGFVSLAFAAGGRSVTLTEPVLCLADLPLTMADAGKLVGRARWFGRPMLVVTEAPGRDVVEFLVADAARSETPVIPVGAPWYGPRRRDFLADLAAATGATVLLPELMHSFAGLQREHLGSASVVIVEAEATTVIGGGGYESAVARRVAQVDAELARTERRFERDGLVERRGRLSGQSFVLSVGAASDQEKEDLRRRAVSAVAAGRAAVTGGVVAGGGIGLLRAARQAAGGDLGSALLLDAATDLVRLLAYNAGIESQAVLGSLPEDGTFDARTGVWATEPDGAVVDPLLVVSGAVLAAVSVAGTALSSEAIVLAA
jgi:chaperonin GroEL